MIGTIFCVAMFAASVGGVESDAQSETVSPASHLKVTAWDLRDRTDNVGELVQMREWLLLNGTDDFDLECNVADVQNILTGKGTVHIRLAPLPGSRTWTGADFKVQPSSLEGLIVLDRPAKVVSVTYEGGNIGRRTALIKAQRTVRPYIAGRDGLFLSNTWGDRNRDSRICETFMRREIESAVEIGVDVIQIDDGWQKGRTANSSAAKGNGVWNGYWTADPEFWTADPLRFPNGLKPLIEQAAAKGIRFGLWFGPDSSNEALNWEKDAKLLLKYHRDLGINFYKIDSMKTTSPLSLERQQKLFSKVLAESNHQVVFDLDVTAERRPGYFGLIEIGPVFVENRYTDWHKYWPHQTLRQFWALADIVDPVRLRMEFLNPLRNRDKYKDDPLAPAEWPVESIFASIMLGSPLGWFETSTLAPETKKKLAPFVSLWKQHRARLHRGIVHPVGAKPDGVSWTGFVVVNDKHRGYALFFRELHACPSFTFDLTSYLNPTSAKVLSPRGKASLKDGTLSVTIPQKLDFIWVELDAHE